MSSTEDLTAVVEGLLHEETQVTENGLDLTVAEVYVVDQPGRIDFGGGELESATMTAHDKELRNPDDDYQWWNLAAGQYLIEYNEQLETDSPFVLQPRRETLERGASHPTLFVEQLPRVPLSVSEGGLKLKENARMSTLLAGPI
jgi:deoxycytidine triphosphate deaminase